MERALRLQGPDVIQSALDKKDTNSETIDNLFGAPEKIVIPERYVPDSVWFPETFSGLSSMGEASGEFRKIAVVESLGQK